MKFFKSAWGRYALPPLLAIIALCTTSLSAQAAVATVTDSQGVIYDVIYGTNKVIVSANNAYVFDDQYVDLVIPATVKDDSTNQDDEGFDTYYVVGMGHKVFNNCRITSCIIEAPIEEIPDSTFFECNRLTKVVLPSTVKKIGHRAFYDCYNLTDMTIPETVESIGLWSFYYTKIPSIKLTSIKEIPPYAFYYCYSMTTAEFSDNLKTIGNSAFRSCSALTSLDLGQKYEKIDTMAFQSCSKLPCPTFPETCTRIGRQAFMYCSSLGDVVLTPNLSLEGETFRSASVTSITWPETPIEIGTGKTFYSVGTTNTNKLLPVYVPEWMENLTDIYANSSAITSIDIRKGVKTIESGALKSMTGITTLTLPEGFQEIKRYGVDGCTKLKTVTFVPDMKLDSYAIDNCKVIYTLNFPTTPMEIEPYPFGTAGNTSLYSFIIPNWITDVPEGFFYGFSNLYELTLHDQLKTIGHYAFYKNKIHSNYLKFPATLTYIGKFAFASQSVLNFRALVFPETLEIIDFGAFSATGLNYVKIPSTLQKYEYAFAKCPNLTQAYFLEGCEKVDPQAFYNCTALRTIDFGTIKEIGDSAFAMCGNLPMPTFPATLERIGKNAFRRCESLYKGTEYCKLPGNCKYDDYCFGESKIFGIEWSDEKVQLGERVFAGAEIYRMKTADEFDKLPAWMDTIPYQTFFNIPMERLVMGGNVRHVGEEAFAVQIPDPYLHKEITVAEFNRLAKYYDRARRRVTLPTEPCTWGKSVFKNCAMYQIHFPDWMTVVPERFTYRDPNEYKEDEEAGEGAIYEVPHITWNNIERIEKEAFTNMMIHDFNMTDKIKYIGVDAFKGAYVYVTLPFMQKQEENNRPWDHLFVLNLYEGVKLDTDCFRESTIREIIFHGCPDVSERGIFQEVQYLQKVTMADCMEEIPNNMFLNCHTLKSINAPASLKRIGNLAFAGCDSVAAFPFNNGLEYIGYRAFDGCYAWDKVTWPTEKIDSISQVCFSGFAITDLTIPQWMDRIPNFDNCRNLTEVKWEDRSGRTDFTSLHGIGFRGDSLLTKFELPSNVPVWIDGSGFNGCKSLETINANADLRQLAPNGCFAWCKALKEIPSLEKIHTIPYECFRETGSLEGIQVFEGLKTIEANAFRCSSIKTLDLPFSCTDIKAEAFAYSDFDHIDIPGHLESLPNKLFYSSTTKKINIGEGPTKIGEGAFSYCSELLDITLPTTISRIPAYCFANSEKLKKVNLKSDYINFEERAFCYCYDLEEIRIAGVCDSIGNWAFGYAGQLAPNGTDFIIESGQPIKRIGDRGFSSSGIKEFPYLHHADIHEHNFEYCNNMRQIVLPEEGVFLEYLKVDHIGNGGFYLPDGKWNDGAYQLLYNCHNLQSIVFPDDDHWWNFQQGQWGSAPLLGLSYVNDTQLIPRDFDHPEKKYTLSGMYLDRPEEKRISPLVVRRNEMWKFYQTKWDGWFKLMEKKEPVINLKGCIYSNYDVATNRNKYKANVMWDLALSDLNAEKPTTFTVYRGDDRSDKMEKVATLRFSVPSDSIYNTTLEKKVIEVDVEVEYPDGAIKPNEFKGDFDFPVEVDGDTIYQVTYAMQWNKLYFDAKTSKRLAIFDRDGYYPWFVLVEEFWSPVLSDEDVPRYYNYRVEMDDYEYDKPVNNKNLEVDPETGVAYHYERAHTGHVSSAVTRFYPTFAMPSLEFAGLYKEADVRADRNLAADNPLTPTNWDYVESFDISYKLDPKVASMKGRLPSGQIIPVVDWVQVREVKRDLEGKDYTDTITPKIPVEYGTDFLANLPKDLKLDPSKRYITVTRSGMRGTFGSPVMSVPDLLELTAKVKKHGWSGHNHVNGARMHSELLLEPNVSKMGYGDTPLKATDYYVGIWRHFNPQSSTLSLAPLREDADFTDGVLIHHCGEELAEATCGDCAGSLTHNSDGTITYHDYLDVDWNTTYGLTYTTRAYVKVPESMIPGETRYMLAEYAPETSGAVAAGIEDVAVDTDNLELCGEETFYDLRGIRVLNPIEGELYIRVTPAGSSVILKTKN